MSNLVWDDMVYKIFNMGIPIEIVGVMLIYFSVTV